MELSPPLVIVVTLELGMGAASAAANPPRKKAAVNTGMIFFMKAILPCTGVFFCSGWAEFFSQTDKKEIKFSQRADFSFAARRCVSEPCPQSRYAPPVFHRGRGAAKLGAIWSRRIWPVSR